METEELKNINVWALGGKDYRQNDTEKSDKLENFINNNYWEYFGTDKKQTGYIKDVKLGDFVFLKTSGNRGTKRTTGFMRIYATGKVTGVDIYNNKLLIDWKKLDSQKEATGTAYRSSINKVDKNNNEDLINFIFYSTERSFEKNHLNKDSADTINGNVEENDTKKEQKLNDELKKYLGQNVIFYGVPGCGKSHYVNELLAGVDDNCKMRILFHPEYGYSDFVGQVMPVVKENNKGDKIIDYEFVPGPFVEILKDALDNENDVENKAIKYFLIIEEINRGNAPAIFGDIFQLLDRDENGKSEYEIYNRNISDWLKTECKNYKGDKIYIPRNLTILATMNTCDQNVFTLDTAFKRRWRMTRIENDLNNASTNRIGGMNFSWREFVKALNADILTKCNEGMLAEDKLLGAYFVKESEIADARVFAEKIFMYLWNDVVKYNKEQLFRVDLKTLDDVIKEFIKGINVFNDNCGNLASLYKHTDNVGENDQGN